eukprot:CAMPEP_0197831976 /NCGR_PEP_ID=MMETSP1437-20131217/12882_1 /TAXON_ID=49252 ORGANISM="Eucampia antarctica, Strain CCMP1452" /NCGR_SAMPLE_ID=MMETSP1437 /ASSEMBLY_ACC=CAM_ASM_001096 /LENGTH=169 /DNA_ID=CAMNT_0043435131 /DNA_START=114 /DNA_END=623 /DNA_ORIENTATION=+
MYRRIATVAISEAMGGLKADKSIFRMSKNSVRWHGGPSISVDAPSVSITFKNPHPSSASSSRDDTVTVKARVGETMLQTAQRNHIDLEGACEGVCACSTCHIIIPDNVFDSMPEACEEEEDMLDMAFGLTATSRLGCQMSVTEDMDGMTIQVPSATRNFYVDGHVPQPH